MATDLEYNTEQPQLLPVHVADVSGRVVTHQQLTNGEFFALVKAPLLTGEVDVIDQRCDKVQLPDGARVGFDDPRAAVALAQSQTRWVGASPEAPKQIFDTLGLDWLTMQTRNAVN